MTYYGHTMFRQQQYSPPNPTHYQANSAWYPAYQNVAGPSSYYPQEEQQVWHHHHHAQQQAVYQHEIQDFLHTGNIPAFPPQHQINGNGMQSPTLTISGSDMSSPGGHSSHSGNITPPQPSTSGTSRPTQARSPYEWIKKNSYQQNPNPGKTRTKDKYRVVYTDHQRIELEKEFTFHNKYITIRRKSELAENLGLSERQIKIWFQNRRAKERKQNKKRQEERTQVNALNGNYLPQNTILNQPITHIQQQNVLPNLVPTTVMQRFIENNHHPLKIESETNEQLG